MVSLVECKCASVLNDMSHQGGKSPQSLCRGSNGSHDSPSTASKHCQRHKFQKGLCAGWVHGEVCSAEGMYLVVGQETIVDVHVYQTSNWCSPEWCCFALASPQRSKLENMWHLFHQSFQHHQVDQLPTWVSNNPKRKLGPGEEAESAQSHQHLVASPSCVQLQPIHATVLQKLHPHCRAQLAQVQM